MDNAAFHKRQDIQDLLSQHGHQILWLPPYSPDLNPIEKMWAWVKAKRKKWLVNSIDKLFSRFFNECMGNQARVAPNTTCVSTSTRNFPNRLGQGANVYLASAELASVAAVLGKLPTPEEYQQYAAQIDSMSADIYQYLSFDKMGDYTDAAANVDTKKIAAAQLT